MARVKTTPRRVGQMMSGDWRYAIHRQHDTEVDAAIGLGGGECAATPFVGVKALMLAILEDAIRAYMGPLDRHHHEAVLWIIDARDPWVFSFRTVCETLGLEPSAVRAALRRIHARSTGGSPIGRSRPNARQHAGLRIAAV